MQFKAALITLAALSAPVLSQSCHSYVILSIRGTYELQGRSIAFTTMINSTLNTIPGGVEYDVVYPAAVNQTAYLGADDATRYITSGLKNCPSQKYAILGYSQGATATMLTLVNYTDPASAAYKAIRAVLVVGNPYHVPNATVNVDEFDGNSTRSYPGVVYNANNPMATGIPQIYYHNGKLLDICHTEDAICAPAYPNATFNPGHLHYGDQNVQDLGASFLIPRLGSSGTIANSTSSGVARPTGSGSVAPTSTKSSQPTSSGTQPSGTPSSYPSGTVGQTSSAFPSASVQPSTSSASATLASSIFAVISSVFVGLVVF